MAAVVNTTPSSTGNVTVIILVARKPGTSLEQFKSYYEHKHIPYAMPIVFKRGSDHGLIGYTRNYIDVSSSPSLTPLGDGYDDTFGYDCVTELVFRSREDRDASLRGFGQHEEAIAADEEKFMDRSKTKIIFVADSVAGLPEGI